MQKYVVALYAVHSAKTISSRQHRLKSQPDSELLFKDEF